MASVPFTAYGKATTLDKLSGGWQGYDFKGPMYLSEPGDMCSFITLSPTQIVGGVTCQTIVEILPSGLITPGFTTKYFTDSTKAALDALANA